MDDLINMCVCRIKREYKLLFYWMILMEVLVVMLLLRGKIKFVGIFVFFVWGFDI